MLCCTEADPITDAMAAMRFPYGMDIWFSIVEYYRLYNTNLIPTNITFQTLDTKAQNH